MKNLSYLVLAPLFLYACNGAKNSNEENTVENNETELIDSTQIPVQEIPEAPKSPRQQAKGTINDVEIEVDFGAPSVREREIWGELVPYDKVWRAGANDATAITFGSDVLIDGQTVTAGTYALFIIPQESSETWTIVLNEEWSKEIHGVWGAYDHKPEKDVLRFEVTPSFENDHHEILAFDVTDKAVEFNWEKAHFSFPVEKK